MELNRNAVLDRIQSRTVTIDEFNFDKLVAPPLYSLLTMEDIDKLYNIATSIRYSGNARKKYKAIDDVLKPRGFTKLGSGTNRVVYKFLEDDTFVIKVAADAVGIKDNPREFINQAIFKPFVTKVFEVDPTGVVAVVERVLPITSREEFISIAEDVYEVINNWFLGEYIMADIGTKFFMNWGTRRGFGPVLLDFPYAYELDGNKLYCSAPDIKSSTGLCGGEIDYDDGFNFLHCTKCGVQYRVRELAKAIKEETILVKGSRRRSKMKVAVRKYGTLVSAAEENVIGEVVSKVVKSETIDTTPVGSLKVSVKNIVKSDNRSNNKQNKQQHKKNTYNGNNRGVVRDTTLTKEAVKDTKEVTEKKTPDTKSSIKVNAFTAEQISAMGFKFSSYDAENNLFILSGDKGISISLDLSTVDAETFNVLFEQSEYMKEFETAKADLLAKEEALEAEKEANVSLSEALDVANKGIEDLRNTIDALDKELIDKDEELTTLKDELEKIRGTVEKEESEVASLKVSTSNEDTTAIEEDYKAKIEVLEAMLSEANDKLEAMNKEIPASNEEIDFDSYEGFSCIHGVITSFNGILEEEGFEEDHKVIAFPDGSGGFIKDVEDNIIVAVSINDKNLDAVQMVPVTEEPVDRTKAAPVGVTQQ